MKIDRLQTDGQNKLTDNNERITKQLLYAEDRPHMINAIK